MTKQFAWGTKWFADADPQAVGEALEAVRERNGGALRPADVVNAAVAKSSPLHSLFEWDDAEAAEAHRREQAGHVIRSIRVNVIGRDAPEPRRIYVSVQQDDGRAYLPITVVKRDPELNAAMMTEAKRGLSQWRARYQELRVDLPVVFDAIDQVVGVKTAREHRRTG